MWGWPVSAYSFSLKCLAQRKVAVMDGLLDNDRRARQLFAVVTEVMLSLSASGPSGIKVLLL